MAITRLNMKTKIKKNNGFRFREKKRLLISMKSLKPWFGYLKEYFIARQLQEFKNINSEM